MLQFAYKILWSHSHHFCVLRIAAKAKQRKLPHRLNNNNNSNRNKDPGSKHMCSQWKWLVGQEREEGPDILLRELCKVFMYFLFHSSGAFHSLAVSSVSLAVVVVAVRVLERKKLRKAYRYLWGYTGKEEEEVSKS